MKLYQKILLVLGILLSVAGVLTYDAFYAAPSRYSIRYETLNSIYIPEQLNDVNILYFSDLDYNHFMDASRMEKLVNTINELAPDVVIFGGDLFDQESNPITQETIDTLTSYLSQIQAPLGKFAVYGDFDHQTPERLDLVTSILYNSDFEILNNESVYLRKTGSQAIVLVGLDSGLYGTPDVSAAFANVSPTSYTIAICHTPDLVDYLPLDNANYVLSGHSHGGQVYYFFGAQYTPEMATTYFRGKHTIGNNMILDISNGVGTTEKDIRFLANAEIVLYRLHHKTVTDTAGGN